MRMKCLGIVGVLVVLAACGDSPVVPNLDGALLSAGRSLVDVCHVDGQGRISRITVADAALPAHIDHGDQQPESPLVLPAGSSFSASATWNDNGFLWSPDLAFDGDAVSRWNAGAHPVQWIEVDFGSPQTFSSVEAVVHQSPSIATSHDVSLDGSLSFNWSGATVDGQVLSHAFGAPQTAQTVRITTTASESWVAWYEIRFIRVNC